MVQEIHPQTFDDGAWTWIDPGKTYNNNLSDYGYFNEQVWDTLYVLAVWSAFESKDPWEDDGDIKLKITTIGWSGHHWGLRYSDLDSPNWHGQQETNYEILKAMSNDNVAEQTYSADVPEGFDWTKAKIALVGESAGPPETPTARVFDNWGEGVLGPLQVNEEEEFSASESIEFSVGQGLAEGLSGSGAHALAVGLNLGESQALSDLCALLTERSLGESQVVTDEIDCLIVGLRLEKAEQQIVLEAVATEVSKSLLDEMTSGDLISFGYFVAVEEGVSASDLLSKQSLGRYFEEMGSISDALGGFGWGREFAVDIPVADLVLLMPGLVEAEQATLADGIETYLVTGLLCSEEETAQMSEALALAVEARLSELMAASEAGMRLLGKAVGEVQATTEDGIRQVGLGCPETLNAADVLAFAAAHVLTDGAELSDLLSLLAAPADLEETIAPSDRVALRPGPEFAESLTGADSFAGLRTYLRSFAEQAVPGEIVELAVQPRFEEETPAADSLVLSTVKGCAEAVAVADAVSSADQCHAVDSVEATDVFRAVLNPLLPPQVGPVEFEDTTRVFYWEDTS